MKRNAIEWLVLLASVAGIVVLVGTLVVVGLTETQPADPQIELHTAEARQGTLGWLLPATLSNGGDEAVEAVLLEATARVAGTEEKSELEVDFLPAGTNVEVSFSFSAQPDGEVSVRLVGYRVP